MLFLHFHEIMAKGKMRKKEKKLDRKGNKKFQSHQFRIAGSGGVEDEDGM